ncbi:NAAT family transporter [bacterium]|nr:NAAT family transporter [bacterium]
MDTLSVFVTLLLIMDPFGNIPVFLPILERIPESRRRKVLVRELFLALAVIVLAVFGGNAVMSFLGLREQSVSIAGGIILFLIALRMVFPAFKSPSADESEAEPFLVPLAIPMIAGPSLLAVLLLFASGAGGNPWQLLLAAILAWSAVFIILFSSTFLYKVLSKRGLMAVERLMGMVLIALAVQLFIDGIAGPLN